MVADILMYIFSAFGVGSIVFLLIKKVDIIISLFAVGILLLIVALSIGRVPIEKPIDVLFPLQAIINNFKTTLSSAGFIILLLGGYTGYMTHIGANAVVVDVLTKPLLKIKRQYWLIPIVFILGNVLSLGVPSASTLAIILMATLFPVLTKTGINPLAAIAVIATTATIMPTPLGADNVAIAEALGMSVSKYVFMYHAVISLPTLVLMTFAHLFWQMYLDKRDHKKGVVLKIPEDLTKVNKVKGGAGFKTVYTILPLLPIFLLILTFCISLGLPEGKKFELGVELVTFISFIIAMICETVRNKNLKTPIKETVYFWKGMGNVIETVVLLVAANVFVAGLTSIGLIAKLQDTMQTANLPGIVLPIILQLFTFLIVLLSGSGTSLIFAMAPLILPLSQAAGIPPQAVSIPLQMSGNLLRSMSPVAAVVIIVSKQSGATPFQVVKRTSVPILIGTFFSFGLAMALFLTGAIA